MVPRDCRTMATWLWSFLPAYREARRAGCQTSAQSRKGWVSCKEDFERRRRGTKFAVALTQSDTRDFAFVNPHANDSVDAVYSTAPPALQCQSRLTQPFRAGLTFGIRASGPGSLATRRFVETL